MLVIFGLGNPGPKYDGTRHNAGVDTLTALAAFFQVTLRKRCFCNYRSALVTLEGDKKVKLVFPLTYMNNSGEAVKGCVKEGDEVLVICDQMDLPPGKIRLRLKGSSSAGHNGLKSMMANLPDGFMRMYIGVGHPSPGVSVPDHVLSSFSEEESILVKEAEKKAVSCIVDLINGMDRNRLLQEANS